MIVTSATMAKCGSCGETKLPGEFHKSKANRSGLQNKCKACYRKSYSENPKKWSDRLRLQRYGVTELQYADMYRRQNGRCAICLDQVSSAPRERTKSAHIDHDHATGRVRGLLCAYCNVGLAQFKDSADRLRGAISYLKRTGG